MLRTMPERILQTVCFEVIGLIITMPVFAHFTKTGESETFLALFAISVGVICWSAIHNYLFDWTEFRLTQRVASDRTNTMRIIHALSHELSSVVVSLPLMLWIAGLTWQQALMANVGLTIFYTVYAFVFYRIYDALRPMEPVNFCTFASEV